MVRNNSSVNTKVCYLVSESMGVYFIALGHLHYSKLLSPSPDFCSFAILIVDVADSVYLSALTEKKICVIFAPW